jgi:uncharacterized protein
MLEYPGVYVEEVTGAFHSISGVSPSIGELSGLVNRENIPLRHGTILSVRGRENAVWESDWKYVNVRREVVFIEQSLGQQRQWVVFEPNEPALWSRVTQSVDGFLTSQWLQGSLHGKKKDEAFFVKCDRSTMTQNDLDNGRLVIVVGIAPVHPAEFVVFRIGIWTDPK